MIGKGYSQFWGAVVFSRTPASDWTKDRIEPLTSWSRPQPRRIELTESTVRL